LYAVRQNLDLVSSIFNIGDWVVIEEAESGHKIAPCEHCFKHRKAKTCHLQSVFVSMESERQDRNWKAFKIVQSPFGGSTAIAFKNRHGYLSRVHDAGCQKLMERTSFLTYEKELGTYSTWLWKVFEDETFVLSSLPIAGPPRYLSLCKRDECTALERGHSFEVADWVETADYPDEIKFRLTKIS